MFVLNYLKDYYRTDEVAKTFAVHRNTVLNWSDSGKLICDVTPTGHRRYPVAELVKLGASVNR